MTDVLLLILGLILGGAAGFYAGRLRGRSSLTGEVAGLQAALDEVRGQAAARERDTVELRAALEVEKVAGADAKARLESSREHFAEQRKLVEDMDKRVRETFTALSTTALKSSNEQFLTLAETRMKPIREQMARYEKQIGELEKTRLNAYSGLNERLDDMKQGRKELSAETRALAAALRQPGAKGRWGESSLRRIVELAGLSEHCDFDEQPTLTGDGGTVRPDMVVHLPGGRSIVLDSKVNTSAYLDAVNAENDDEKKRHLDRYAKDVRSTMRSLAGKEYWKRFDRAPQFVVMFMPGEAFFAAAMTQDPDLFIDGVENNVIFASPTTLVALLMAVRHGWQQQALAENAEQIAKAGRELHDRLLTFVNHLDDIRVGINKAGEAYDRAVGSWKTRALPGARRLAELGAAEPGKPVPELPPTDLRMRPASTEGDDGLLGDE